LDGFILTHTYEPIGIPTGDQVKTFLPDFDLENKMDLDKPKNLFFSSSPEHNMGFKYQQHQAMEKAKKVIQEIDERYETVTGRSYGGLVESYHCEDAQHIIITLGSITGLVRDVVDELRGNGEKVGVLKIRYMRPFPEQEIRKYTHKAKTIGVLEKDISFGYQGTVFTNVASALRQSEAVLLNYIAGLGGKNISKQDIITIYDKLKAASAEGTDEIVHFVGVEVSEDEN
jgi:pyruvate ferredoxin oxidoreductase alpha subunit